MKINKLTPMLYTNDVQGTIDFYVRILGFACLANEPGWNWAQIELGDAQLMLCKPNEHIPFDKPQFTGSFYFNLDDADEAWSKLKDKVAICYPIESFEYGMREFGIYDNNGYLLQFGHNLQPA